MVTLRQHHGRPVDTNTPHIPVRGSAECRADHRARKASTLIDGLVWTTGGEDDVFRRTRFKQMSGYSPSVRGKVVSMNSFWTFVRVGGL